MVHKAIASKHLLIMLACCLIPLAVLGAVLFLKVDFGSLGFFAIMLLCPLLHIFMMRSMGHDHEKAGQPCHQEMPPKADAPEAVTTKSS